MILKENFDENAEKQPKIDLGNGMESYDFGKIQQDSTLEMSFTIKNLGNKKLKIKKISSNCDCIQFDTIPSKIAKNKECTLILS